MKFQKMNKKGYSLSSWAEAMIACVLIVAMVGIIMNYYNERFSKTYDLGFNTPQMNSTMNRLLNYANDSQDQLSGGEVNFNSASGLTLLTSWGLITTFFSILWDFLMGSWINTIIVGNASGVGGLGLGPAGFLLAGALQLLYILSLVWIALYLLFRVQP